MAVGVRVACAAALFVSVLVARSADAQAGADTVASSAPEAGPAPALACPNCCEASVEIAPRAGISINGDQWLVGGSLRTSMPCLGDLGLGPVLVAGLGGNHFTVQSAGRLDYLFWFDDDHSFGIDPAIGLAVLYYLPVGRFATFCHRTDLDECQGYEVGAQLGGGLRFGRLGIDAFLGFGGLPVVTLMAFWSFDVAGPGWR